MQERYARTVGAMTNPRLYDLDPLVFRPAQSCRQIGSSQTDVVYSGSAAREEPGNG